MRAVRVGAVPLAPLRLAMLEARFASRLLLKRWAEKPRARMAVSGLVFPVR